MRDDELLQETWQGMMLNNWLLNLRNYLLRYETLYTVGLILVVMGIFLNWWCTTEFASHCFSGIDIGFLRGLEQGESLIDDNGGVLILFLATLTIPLKLYFKKLTFWSNISIHLIGFGLLFVTFTKLEHIKQELSFVGSHLGLGLPLILAGAIFLVVYGAVNLFDTSTD